ncbi:MAG: DUF3299 domain-containing protein [Bdellovibrionaceae bacterium]|nr:DUF3299 domain-containing protein [Pseudobdellovibrionaceae bacterium]
MKRIQFLGTLAVFCASLVGGFYLFQGASSFALGDVVEIDWRLLGQLDYISGQAGGELEKLDGKTVRIPGFMVPLEDDMKRVTEFLLVPSPQACIHVPPPPPNQMVLIDMAKVSGTEVAYGPIWVYGTLHLKPKRHLYGESSFSMDGVKIEKYQSR